MGFAESLVGLVGSFAAEVRYTVCPKRYAERLRTRMDELNRNKDSTHQAARVKITEQPWSEINPHVKDWIDSVEALSGRVGELNLEGDLPFWRRLCCCYTYELGDKIQQYLEEIERLGNERPDANKGDLVIDVIPIADLKEKLENEMEKLKATARDLDNTLSLLETSVAFPPKVRSEKVKWWIRIFDSLETEVSEVLGSIGSATAATSTSATNPNEVTVAASTSATDSDEAAATSNEAATKTSELKRNIQIMTGRISEHSDQLKKLKAEDGLVVEALPGLEALQNVLQDLRLKKKELESRVSDLERAAVNPCKVRSQGVRSWLGKFDSLEEKVSKLVDSIKSQAEADTLANTPNATAEAVAGTSSATTSHAAATEANTSNAAAEVAATHSQQNSEIQTMSTTVTGLFEKLEKLKEEDELVVEAPPQRFHELPGDRSAFVVGLEEKLEEIETLLNDGKTEVILIHGMGGSGKTTLVRELTKKLRSKGGGEFDFILSVVVSENLDIHKIQGDILVQLGYTKDDGSLPQNIDHRSKLLERNLNQKSFLLVLDDLWEPLQDLPSKLGFHPSSSSKKCKVLVTSRKADVCEGREYIAALKSGLLEKGHAWELFCRKSGLDKSDKHICALAKEIAEKCGGLPLLVKTVASAMVKNRGYEDWFIARNQLNNFPDSIRNMDQVYEKLKFSFDRLENDGLRVCLLYCALFGEDYSIRVDKELIPYLIAEGFVDGKYDFDFDTLWHKARHDIIEKLKESSLLETGRSKSRRNNDDDYVKLHDAVREMLLSLGNDWKVISCAKKGRDGRINVDSWDGVRMASVWETEDIENIASAGEVTLSSLRTLLVGHWVGLPTSLFPQFSSLRILDLSTIYMLSEIPKSIGSLKSLLYLSLSQAEIKELPVEIGNLTNLHTLDLSDTRSLYEIPRDAISPLKMLQSLNLWRCPCFEYEKEGMLKVVDVSRGLPKLKDVGLELYDSIDDDVAERLFPLTSQLSFKHMDIDNVTSSKISKLQRLKYLSLWYVGSGNIVLKSPCWRLQKLRVYDCHDFEHLGWIRHLPSLTFLHVSRCYNLQELVPKDMSEENRDESSCRYDDPTILLSKLQQMQLEHLPKLESISSVKLPFPCLSDMRVRGCPRIRSLPIKSSNSVRTNIFCQKEWWESLEDDECDSSRFIPRFW